MNRAKILVIGALLLAASPVLAQDATPPAGGDATPAGGAAPAAPAAAPEAAPEAGKGTKTVGADAAFVLPLSDYSDVADAALGVFGRFEYGINAQLAVTGRLGFLYNLDKSVAGVSPTTYMIPVYVGAKYSIGTSGLFADAELGLNYISTSVDVMGMSQSQSDTKFSFLAGPGYQKGKLSARALLFFTQGDKNLIGIMANVGYDFAKL